MPEQPRPTRPERVRPLPPDPDRQNEVRAGWAGSVLGDFIDMTGTDREDAVADLLCDLRHWCDRNNMLFMRELRRAQRMYRDETYSSEQIDNNVTTPPPPPEDVPF